MFAALSSPCHVARVWGFLFSRDSFCFRDDAFGFRSKTSSVVETLSTMVLSEARGLQLFLIIRGGL